MSGTNLITILKFAFAAVSSLQSKAAPDPQSAVSYNGQFRTEPRSY